VIAVDVKVYNALKAHSSTGELNHLVLCKYQQYLKMYTMFNREPMQCWQNRANMVILPGSGKNSCGCILDQL